MTSSNVRPTKLISFLNWLTQLGTELGFFASPFRSKIWLLIRISDKEISWFVQLSDADIRLVARHSAAGRAFARLSPGWRRADVCRLVACDLAGTESLMQLCVIPGDGIGHEVIPVAVSALRRL